MFGHGRIKYNAFKEEMENLLNHPFMYKGESYNLKPLYRVPLPEYDELLTKYIMSPFIPVRQLK
jgi:hypothetical protein